MQEVELDSKIKLIDCPGIVFAQQKNADDQTMSNILKNAQRVSEVKDPFKVAESILKRASKLYFCRLYDITEYDTPEEFFAKKAARMGKFRRGGVPDAEGAARSLLNDWNTGKIKYCTQPPEVDSSAHVSASIVSAEAREFEIDNFDEMETEVLDQFTVKVEDAMDYTSAGPVHMQQFPDDNTVSSTHIIESSVKDEDMDDDDDEPKQKRGRTSKKVDPEMLLDGNQTTNKNLKNLQKKQKKTNKRNEKKVNAVADVLENFTLDMGGGDEDYDFKANFD